MANNEIDPLKDSTITFKASTLTEDGSFAIPVFGIGGILGVIVAGVLALVDAANPGFSFTPDVYLWALTPMANVLAIWPLCYMEDMEGQLKKVGYNKQEVLYRTALKSWFKIPGFSKKKLMSKNYVKINAYNKKLLQGDLGNAVCLMGDATHEVTDYLISDAKGIRVERHIEPTPLMLWNDAMETIDEGFGLKKISA